MSNILKFSFKPKDLKLAIARLEWACKELEQDAVFDLSMDTHKKARSLDANAYCWALIGQIAASTGIKKEQVYRDEIKQLGGNYDTVCVPEKAADTLKLHWERNGLGWMAEQFASKIPGCVNLNLFYGSSIYDSAQMARLIDNVAQDATALGIETKTPKELALLKEEWGK